MLKIVTITGADDSIDVFHLQRLSEIYPFVEWGILFSANKQGSLRYPTPKWIEDLRLLQLEYQTVRLSAHLCGQWVTDLCNGNFTFIDYLSNIRSLSYLPQFEIVFNRAQLNMTDSRFISLDLKKLKETLGSFARVILQTKRDFERSEEILALNEGPIFDMLYDASGGKGIAPNHWAKPVKGIFCGEAGGLGPDNIAEQLPIILEIAGDSDIWIDMESKVRNENNKFDISKVEKVLEICQKFMWDQIF